MPEKMEMPEVRPGAKVAFIGSECYPFIKTGGLGDVMYALPRALLPLGCEVRVFLPCYRCIPEKYRDHMEYRGSFMMDLTQDGRAFYVGIMELTLDGVIYDFIRKLRRDPKQGTHHTAEGGPDEEGRNDLAAAESASQSDGGE